MPSFTTVPEQTKMKIHANGIMASSCISHSISGKAVKRKQMAEQAAIFNGWRVRLFAE